MTIAHEVIFVDANFSEGQLAGEVVPAQITPTAEAIGMAAVPQALHFADRTPRASDVARQQLNTDAGREEAARRRALEEAAQERQRAQNTSGNEGS